MISGRHNARKGVTMTKKKRRFAKKTGLAAARLRRRLRTRAYYVKVFFLRFRGALAVFALIAAAVGLFFVFYDDKPPKIVKPADYAPTFEKGTRLYQKGRFEDAYGYLYPVRDVYPAAKLMLGQMFYEGKGVHKDVKTAYEYFKSAAETDDEAKFMAAQMGFRGEMKGMRKGLATKMLTEAAYAGVVGAQRMTGVFYMLSGENEQAYFWLSLAAKNDDEKAAALAEDVKKTLSDDQIALLDLEIAGFDDGK